MSEKVIGRSEQSIYDKKEAVARIGDVLCDNPKGTIILDVAHGGDIKLSEIREVSLHETSLNIQDLLNLIESNPIDRGQYVLYVDNGAIKFCKLRKRWIQKKGDNS